MRFFKVLNKNGFTLIELMIVMSIVGIIAAIAAPNYQWGLIKAKESVLVENLYNLTTTIDQFCADQGKCPESLDELKTKGYMRQIPKDPFTGQADWVYLRPPPDQNGVIGFPEVHSSSNLVDSRGKPYNAY